MGTRNLVCVLKDGEFRVAQYGQWDGYPTGQGNVIADFLCNSYDKNLFATRVDSVRVLSRDEIQERWKSCGADDSGWVGMDVSERFKKRYPILSRDCGAEVLQHIQDSPSSEVHMDLDFAGDSLFCEYAYVVNLDTQELEIYKGLNKEPLAPKDRFFFLQKDNAREAYDGTKYYPVKLFKSIPFSNITPKKTMKDLEIEIYAGEE